ncbi:cytochrome P450 [Aspergillus luchuensis]|uniref:Uncharacterized protein n=1 Tax=Aspergillus kawachii TaxID=1069201 RepID=A0A7R7W7U7_ASPKA|nr:uncharacterized protein AKAW2_31309A [Aspergillus luchuensis]BCR97991.1 hypothetical protein AKAW2_31309A [Aspergillus luchuensis]BCS10443.1 hypothetical protein ALUC_31260A [Aspergillus luchuensis]GAA83294.1 hypothetical protein AKAW_01409 [Aspergillus luchuensis IFO 4308]
MDVFFWRLFLGSATVLAAFTSWSLVCLILNVREARSTGLPYVILPCSLLGAPWLLSQPVVLPLFRALPRTWTSTWLPLLIFNDGWHLGYTPFEQIGADTFLAVSPGGFVLYTCDRQVSTQLFQDGRFGKPAHLMKVLNIYGPTMTGTDGPESRLYRRLTAPFFREDTLRHVFVHAIEGAQALGLALIQPGAYCQLRTLAARLSLNLLNRICFQFQTQEDLIKALSFADLPAEGYRMTYSEAMHTLLEHYQTVFLFPRHFLAWSPFKHHRQAIRAFTELGQYMQELKTTTEARLLDKEYLLKQKGTKLLSDLLIQAGINTGSPTSPILQPHQVTGNVFLFMFAGHEANANTLTFIILLLACHPTIQTALQSDLDAILGNTPPIHWTYDTHYEPLMHSLVGAVIKEALRLFTVLPVLPKYVSPYGPPIPIVVSGQSHPLPPGTVAFVNTSATHRHPQYWPTVNDKSKESSTEKELKLRPYPTTDFNPYRWLQTQPSGSSTYSRSGSLCSEGFTPAPGTFIPFSEGSRKCLGHKFALVELCAVVALLFYQDSVHLLTNPEDASDTWEAARIRADRALSEGVKFNMSLRITQDVPIKFETRDTKAI